METIQDRLASIMKIKNWRRADLAKAMHVSQATISLFFVKNANPSYESLRNLVSSCPDVSANWILTGEGSMARGAIIDYVDLPISGEIAAGMPTEMIEADDHKFVTLHKSQINCPDEYLVFRVYGDSMAPVIVHNDIILLHTRFDPFELDGQICAVKVDQEVTLKRIWINEAARQTVLLPYNHHYKPLVLSDDSPDCRIIGYMVSMIRNF